MITIKGYYSNYDILFEIIHQLRYRELCLIPVVDGKSQPPIRWLNAQYIDMLKRHWTQYDFFVRRMNIYHSLARYKDFPVFSYSLTFKSQQQKVWSEEFHKRIVGYDLFLETDSTDLNHSMSDAKKIRDLLDVYKQRFYCQFSGSKGVHIYLDFSELQHLPLKPFDISINKKVMKFDVWVRKHFPVSINNMHKVADLVILCKIIAMKLKLILNAETMDTGVQDVKRVKKLAYSYDVKSDLISYPLDDDMIDNFDRSLVTPERVLRYNNHKRGLLWRNEHVPLTERQEHMTKILKDLNILI
jgi:hypothetical protein